MAHELCFKNITYSSQRENLNMLEKKFNQLIEDLQKEDVSQFSSLYQEDLILDFKRTAPLSNWDEAQGQEKKSKKDPVDEFASDIASFANTSGGILVYGVEEDNRIPTKFSPFEITSSEKLDQRIQSILDSRLYPKLYGCKFRTVTNKEQKSFYVILVPKSWNGPHSVKNPSKDYYKFYGRNPTGDKYPYQHNEIKSAFILRENIESKIKIFREDRINKILADETELPLLKNAKIVLHLFPLSAFESRQAYDVNQFYNDYKLLYPMNDFSGLTRRRNFNGLLVHEGNENSSLGYVQLYRNGIIEAVDAYTLELFTDYTGTERASIPMQYEQRIVAALERYLEALKSLGIYPPLFIALTLIGVKEHFMWVDPRAYMKSKKIGLDILLLPEEEVIDMNTSTKEFLRDAFDLIRNSCDLENVPNKKIESIEKVLT